MLKALADRLAEAFTELLHKRVRMEFWGYAKDETLDNAALIDEKYRGIRPAPGYPACPDHTEKGALFDLLRAPEIGITVTESYAMWPASSVSGFYLSHPQSQYFAVGKIARDQVEDYARRKNMPLADAERWLSQVAAPWRSSVTSIRRASTATAGTPRAASAAATSGAESRSPKDEMRSVIRAERSRRSATPDRAVSSSARGRASKRTRAPVAFERARAASSWRARRAPTARFAAARRPPSASRAAARSWSVTPPIAEATATTGPRREADFRRSAAQRIRTASPSEVPPNLWTDNVWGMTVQWYPSRGQARIAPL